MQGKAWIFGKVQEERAWKKDLSSQGKSWGYESLSNYEEVRLPIPYGHK